MKTSAKERQRAERLLQSRQIRLQQIESFSFMERYRPATQEETPPGEHFPRKKTHYGPGIFVFHLKGKRDKALHLPPFRHPSSLVRYLVSEGVPFANHIPRERSTETVPAETYRRPSLYMFWFFVLFLMFLALGYYSLSGDAWWRFIPALLSFGLSLSLLCMLMTRFCYLELDNEALTVHSVGRTLRYPYAKLRKVNFDFAREQAFTHVMELLDNDYRYRLFYIGRVSRKKLNEIVGHLLHAGVDATCSLNDSKRFYKDKISG